MDYQEFFFFKKHVYQMPLMIWGHNLMLLTFKKMFPLNLNHFSKASLPQKLHIPGKRKD